jgi:hypothetical protein
MIGQGGGGLSSLGRGRYQHVFFVIYFMEIESERRSNETARNGVVVGELKPESVE